MNWARWSIASDYNNDGSERFSQSNKNSKLDQKRYKPIASLNEEAILVPSVDIVRFISRDRSMGGRRIKQPVESIGRFIACHVPSLLQEKEYSLRDMNKIFAARWVSDRQVVFGTKCNKLTVIDLITHQMAQIPSLVSGAEATVSDCPCGIHSIAVNPSNTLLATGGDNVNDLAVYALPTFDPVCVGEETQILMRWHIAETGHTDWIFDIEWLDDEFVVSGSRDSNMALWLVKHHSNADTHDSLHAKIDHDQDNYYDRPTSSARLAVSPYAHIKPRTIVKCKRAEKIRAFAFNDETKELAVLSLNAFVHIWDAGEFTQKSSRKLKCQRENVCMGFCHGRGLFAVGSQSYVSLIDTKSKQTEEKLVHSLHPGTGVRSLSFLNDVLTIGTGSGSLFFYDVRASKYLDIGPQPPLWYSGPLREDTKSRCINIGKGYLRYDEQYQEYFADQDHPHAIYTHCFDASGTKLFTAGGPLPAGLWGNYAGLWQ